MIGHFLLFALLALMALAAFAGITIVVIGDRAAGAWSHILRGSRFLTPGAALMAIMLAAGAVWLG
jgi:hypothetical protein